MEANIKLGRIWGIPIGLHTSWFLVFILLTWSLITGYFPGEYRQLSIAWYIVLGVITSLFFFASVLGHELGHSYIALRNQIPVNGITLFIFGGVAQIGQEPRSAGAEFRIAIAGPIVSFALAGLFGLVWVLDRRIPVLAAPSLYLMRINLLLALFNMIPGFPLDGGRVLRAFVWWLGKDFRRATRVATFSGQLIAFSFLAFGVFTLVRGEFLNGLWLVFIGWFLQNAAASAYAQTNMQYTLQDVTVQQVMAQDYVVVTGLTPVSRVVDEKILDGGQSYFIVQDNDHVRGMVSLKDISEIPKTKWRFTTIEQAMVPVSRLKTVPPDMDLMTALRIMDNGNLSQLAVMVEGKLVGVLTREQVSRYLRMRAELRV